MRLAASMFLWILWVLELLRLGQNSDLVYILESYFCYQDYQQYLGIRLPGVEACHFGGDSTASSA